MPHSAATSRIRLAAIHQAPLSCSRVRPKSAGSAAPVRYRAHASPATRNWSRGHVQDVEADGEEVPLPGIQLRVGQGHRCWPAFQYPHTQWSANVPGPK